MQKNRVFLLPILFLTTLTTNSQNGKPANDILSVNQFIENLANAIERFQLLEIVSDDKDIKGYTFNSNGYNHLDSLTQLIPKYKTELSNSWKRLRAKNPNQDYQELNRVLHSIEKKSLALLGAVNNYDYIENGNFQIDKDALLEETHAFLVLSKKTFKQSKSNSSF